MQKMSPILITFISFLTTMMIFFGCCKLHAYQMDRLGQVIDAGCDPRVLDESEFNSCLKSYHKNN